MADVSDGIPSLMFSEKNFKMSSATCTVANYTTGVSCFVGFHKNKWTAL